MHTWRKTGFTLIELLTVIAIIAVLAAILFPVFSKARAKSYQVTCMSNMKQIGTALTAYIHDTGGFIPTWCLVHNNPGSAPSTPNDPGYFTWDAQLDPYIQESNIYICPANPFAGDARSYAIAHYTQMRLDGVLGGWGAMRGCYRDSMPAPARTVFLFEKGEHPPTAWGDCLGQNVWESHGHKETEAPPDNGSWSEAMFHSDGKNILYCDGHAKFSASGQYPFNYNSGRANALTGDVWVAAKQSQGGDWPQRQ